jgi:hypothetical protein
LDDEDDEDEDDDEDDDDDEDEDDDLDDELFERLLSDFCRFSLFIDSSLSRLIVFGVSR